MATMRDFIQKMPKCELHVHIEGTLEPELKFALAERNGVKLPYDSVEQLKAAYDFDDDLVPRRLLRGHERAAEGARLLRRRLRLSGQGPFAECRLCGDVLRSGGPHGARRLLRHCDPRHPARSRRGGAPP